MVDLVLEHAKEAGAKKVLRINVVAGELSGYADEHMQFYYGQISKDTIAENTKLSLKLIPTQGRCRDSIASGICRWQLPPFYPPP